MERVPVSRANSQLALHDARANEFALRIAIPKYDLTLFADGRAIVKGTTGIRVAKSVYARLIGAQLLLRACEHRSVRELALSSAG
jgi:hypothetical protein